MCLSHQGTSEVTFPLGIEKLFSPSDLVAYPNHQFTLQAPQRCLQWTGRGGSLISRGTTPWTFESTHDSFARKVGNKSSKRLVNAVVAFSHKLAVVGVALKKNYISHRAVGERQTTSKSQDEQQQKANSPRTTLTITTTTTTAMPRRRRRPDDNYNHETNSGDYENNKERG